MKTYVPDLGESIEEAIKNALAISIKAAGHYLPSAVTFTFNGTEMVVDAMENNKEYYMKVWKDKCKERDEAYKASKEYKIAKQKQEERTATLQGEMDVHIEQLCLVSYGTTTPLYFVSWLKRFVELSDNMNVTYSKEIVLNKLNSLGYKENEYVGWEGEWTTEISVKYITGQVINCIHKIGLIPPVAISMCEKVLENKTL